MDEHPLTAVENEWNAQWRECGGLAVVADYGAVDSEYQAIREAVGLYDARQHGLIRITGKDRVAWLHNLVTNDIRLLQPGQGCYAFALNSKGRILFDMNILVDHKAIWLCIDRHHIDAALAHLQRYIITEEVQLHDHRDEYEAIALLGPKAGEVLSALGLAQAVDLPQLNGVAVDIDHQMHWLIRCDFAGVVGYELFVRRSEAVNVWSKLLRLGRSVEIKPVGHAAVDVSRIEAGIPLMGQDIDETILPAETGQSSRAVNYAKGCYLGQEVVERMRSRDATARQLVGVRFGDRVEVHPGAAIQVDSKTIGHITSTCYSYGLKEAVAIGYAKSNALPEGGQVLVGDVSAQVVSLPFVED